MIIIKFVHKILLRFEVGKIIALSWIFGISSVVKYMRNPNPKLSVRILRYFGATIGSGTTIKRTLFIDNAFEDQDSKGDFSNIKIGNNCYVGDCVYFDLANEIIIEDNAVISGNVSFITHSDCNRSEFLNKIFPRKSKQIIIKESAWVGFGATLLSGSVLGEESVLATKSLLNQKGKKRALFLGIPAIKRKNLTFSASDNH